MPDFPIPTGFNMPSVNSLVTYKIIGSKGTFFRERQTGRQALTYREARPEIQNITDLPLSGAVQ
jgi:hypothetical protein